MTQNELNEVLNADPYQKARINPNDAEIRLFLREVNYHCPICKKELQSRKQKKPSQKLFEIAHIYPNRPTAEQYDILHNLERLGNNSESFENKIALCKDCHATQDYHTTSEDYLQLLNIKKQLLTENALDNATKSLGLEDEIENIVKSLVSLSESEIVPLCYDPTFITNKFTDAEVLLKTRILGYVLNFYPAIRDYFHDFDGKNGFHLHILSEQFRSCFTKMNDLTDNKSMIFSHIVKWVENKTQSQSIEACEAVVSFFVQNCEVFNEIS